MSLEITLANALSGLSASQLSLQTVSNNIANARTEGYTRKIIDQTSRVLDGVGYGVEITRITREVDAGVQRLLRTETGNESELKQKDKFLSQINQFFGRPEDNNSITHLIAELSAQFEALAVTPETEAKQFLTVNAANDVLSDLKTMSDELQRIRAQASTGITNAISELNTALDIVVDTNFQIIEFTASNISTAELEDQRDSALNTISEIMDINYYGGSDGSLTVFTGTGRTLIDGQKQTVSYAQPSQLTATLEYTATSATNYIGPGSTGYPTGGIPGIFVGDLDASSDITNSVANGRIKGLVDIRDTELPILQAQLDELAEKLKEQLNSTHNKGAGYPPATGLTGDRYIASDTTFDATGLIRVGIVNDTGALQEDKIYNLSLPEGFAGYESNLFTSSSSDVITTAGTLTFSGDVGASFSTTVAYTASQTLTSLAASINANGTLTTQGISASVITEGSSSRLRIVDAGDQTFNITETGSGTFLTDLTPKVRNMGDLVTGLSAMTNLTATINSDGRLNLTANNNFRLAINELTSSVSAAADLERGFSDFFGLNRLIDSGDSFATYRSDSFTSSSSDVVTTAGSLHFTGNDGSAWSSTVAYTASDTLSSLVTKINADSTLTTEGVTAQVVADGDGFRLQVTDAAGDEFAMVETGGGSLLSDTNLRADQRGLSSSLSIRSDIKDNSHLLSRGTLQSSTFQSRNLNSDSTAFSGTSPTVSAGALSFTINSSSTASISYATSDSLSSVVTAINADATLSAANIKAEVVIDGSNFRLKIVDSDSNNFMITDSGGLAVDVTQGITTGDGTIAAEMAAQFETAATFLAAPSKGGGLAAATTTFSEYSSSILSFSAARALTVDRELTFQTNLRDELYAKNASISSVNMDEELAMVIKFEQSYLAASRVITTTQKLFEMLAELV